jgi:hypothetical protein
MYRLALTLLMGAAAIAQTAEKPPAEVDAALRARMNAFFTLEKNHDFRHAEALISDDTKDYFYNGAKPEIRSFEVFDIHYKDNFTKAETITKCVQMVVLAGFPPGEMTLKVPTLWRFENGDWYLYEDPSKMGGGDPDGVQAKLHKAMEAAASGSLTDLAAANAEFPKMQVDRREVELVPGEPQQVTITNVSIGRMELKLPYPPKGVEIKLDRRFLEKDEKAVITLQAGDDATGGSYKVGVLPTGEIIDIQVKVKN